MMNLEVASKLARLPMEGIVREYPNAPALVLNGPSDLKTPKVLHPAFYGCFDWHSAVHGHWALIRLMRRFSLPEEKLIRERLAENLTAGNLSIEADYIRNRGGFERMYGWAWLLVLAQELHDWDDPDGRRWSDALAPLEQVIVERVFDYLPKLTYPIRVGTHQNTAFALCLIRDYAVSAGDGRLVDLIDDRARHYFQGDWDYPALLEPGGADFLSAALVEADLMRRVLKTNEFGNWFAAFLPAFSDGKPKTLFEPAFVSDVSDPQIGHLIGLNLSRAWNLNSLAAALPDVDLLARSAKAQLDAAWPFIESGHYEGEHWLATYAILALT